MKRYISVAAMAAVAMVSAGCFEFSRNASSITGPSAPNFSVSALAGTYRSINSIPSADSCTNFTWSVTEKTSNSAKGNFSASCQANTLQVTGTAQGTQSGNNIVFQVNATATSGSVACAISLSGTAVIETNQVRVPYTGTSCFGSVSGTEILKRD
ncbi:MAG TPA: hypothetical protein VMN81_05900 [Vicinamibacterales bacterium]|nr:hypothetical protein [Vicinamibacterales bacterium]